MGLTFESSGSFKNTESFFAKVMGKDIASQLAKYGAEGVQALASATPIDQGDTRNAWGYEVTQKKGVYSIVWTNDNVTPQGTPVAILLQYGHGTGSGGYVQGRDYINPAIRPIFDRIANDVWKVVTTV